MWFVLMMKLLIGVVVFDWFGINWWGCIDLLVDFVVFVVLLLKEGVLVGLLYLCGGVDIDFDWGELV